MTHGDLYEVVCDHTNNEAESIARRDLMVSVSVSAPAGTPLADAIKRANAQRELQRRLSTEAGTPQEILDRAVHDRVIWQYELTARDDGVTEIRWADWPDTWMELVVRRPRTSEDDA